MNERKELFRLANIALGIMAPILISGAVLLRSASEALQHCFVLLGFILLVAVFFALDERNQRRKRSGQ